MDLRGAAALLPLVTYGFVLGWSVAWPPGPISAEVVRRGLARGFWPAYALCLGASSGDAVWALVVALGATAVAGLLGRGAPVGSLRGRPVPLADGTPMWVTVHPSFLLRMPDRAQAALERERFVADLTEIRDFAEAVPES